MSRCRVDLINKAFAKMDVTGDEVITADDLKRSYDVTQHPKFKTGEWSRERILKEFLDTFQLGEKDDVVSCSMFAIIVMMSVMRWPFSSEKQDIRQHENISVFCTSYDMRHAKTAFFMLFIASKLFNLVGHGCRLKFR